MNVTTVGAPIFPVTAIGKVVCVSLPVVGMMFFPIFTVYVSNYYDRRSE
jgi:voltage-gated potassium channel